MIDYGKLIAIEMSSENCWYTALYITDFIKNYPFILMHFLCVLPYSVLKKVVHKSFSFALVNFKSFFSQMFLFTQIFNLFIISLKYIFCTVHCQVSTVFFKVYCTLHVSANIFNEEPVRKFIELCRKKYAVTY